MVILKGSFPVHQETEPLTDSINQPEVMNRSMEKDTTVERFIDCAAAAVVLGGVHPKTVERWAREGRVPAYRYFRHWSSVLLNWKFGCVLR